MTSPSLAYQDAMNGIADLYNALSDAENELDKFKNPWIKCSDRLPPNHTKVLCCNRLTIAIATRVNDSWFTSISSYPMHPTHWMPLPPPPKDE